MANKKEQTTIQHQGRDNNGRIIKRSWWKYIIIIFVVVLIIVGVSVGIYYAVRPKYSINGDFIEGKSISNISKDIKDGKGKNVAVFFYEEGDITNWLTWGDKKGSGGSEATDGPLTTVVDSSDNYEYYAVNLSSYSSNEILLRLFADASEKTNDKVYFDPIYSEVDTPGLDSSQGWVVPEYYLDWTATDETYHTISESDDWAIEKTFEISSVLNSDNKYENTFETEEGSAVDIPSGTIMYFDYYTGKLLNVISGTYTLPEDETDNNDALENINSWFTFFDEYTISNFKD